MNITLVFYLSKQFGTELIVCENIFFINTKLVFGLIENVEDSSILKMYKNIAKLGNDYLPESSIFVTL
jgi:hypothetical protein